MTISVDRIASITNEVGAGGHMFCTLLSMLPSVHQCVSETMLCFSYISSKKRFSPNLCHWCMVGQR